MLAAKVAVFELMNKKDYLDRWDLLSKQLSERHGLNWSHTEGM